MDLAYILFLGLAVFVIPALGIIVLRGILKREPYEFELIFMRPGVDDHVKIWGSSLEFKHEINKKEYEIEPDRLYRIKPGIRGKIWRWITGVKESFLVIYQYKKTKPISTPKVKISARILKEVHESRALGTALKSEFKIPMDLKKIALIIGFVVIAAVVYVLVTGEIAI